MTYEPHNSLANIARRDLLLAGAAAGLPVWVSAQAQTAGNSAKTAGKNAWKKAAPVKRSKAMTAAEESEAAIAVAESIADQTGEPVHPAVGTTLRLPTALKLFDGQDFSDARTRGKLLVVFFWASWCPVCKLVEPRLHDFWLKNRAKGIEVLALSTDVQAPSAFAHIQKTGLKYPSSMATAARFSDVMMPRSLPTIMLRSKHGVIVSVDEGDIEANELNDFLIHL